jgi:hypothetical protein
VGDDKGEMRISLDDFFEESDAADLCHVITVTIRRPVFKMGTRSAVNEDNSVVFLADLVNRLHSGVIRRHFLDMAMKFEALEAVVFKTFS